MAGHTPLHLSDLAEPEQRLLSLARGDMPLAELAVRLGVPVGDASTRIEALCARLGVEDRTGLRALTFEDTPVGEEPPPSTAHDAPARYSRRRILSAGVAGGLAIAGGAAGLAYWATQAGSKSPAAPSPTPIRMATASPSGTPTAFDLIKPAASNLWDSRAFGPNEEIDWDAGIFFMNVESGAVEAWRLVTAESSNGEPPVTPLVRSFFGGDLVTAQMGDNTYAIDRKTRAAWQWPSSRLFLSDYIADCYLFRDVLYGNGSGPESPVYFANASLDLQATFTVDARAISPQFVGSPDERRVAYVDGGSDDAPWLLHLRDIATGNQIATHPVGEAGDGFNITLVVSAPRLDAIVVSRSEPAVDSQGTPVANPRSVSLTAPWSGDWANLQQAEAPPPGGFSPDGTSEAVMDVMLSQMGIGGFYWPALTVSNAGGAPRFTWLSVSPAISNSLDSAWLADSSSMVVMNFAGDESGASWQNYAYSLLDAHSGTLTPLDIPAEVAPGSALGALYEYPPAPSPADADILALGPTAALHLASGKLVRANLGPDKHPPTLQRPWLGRPNEVVWSLPVLGRDGPQVPFLIPPKLIHGAIPTPPLRFTVARTGDCLNIRDGASLKGNVIACVQDGTSLTMAVAHAIEGAPAEPWTTNDDGAWLYVSTAGGLAGWVAAAYLDWAV